MQISNYTLQEGAVVGGAWPHALAPAVPLVVPVPVAPAGWFGERWRSSDSRHRGAAGPGRCLGRARAMQVAAAHAQTPVRVQGAEVQGPCPGLVAAPRSCSRPRKCTSIVGSTPNR